jgi:hypothetical protein
MAHGNDPQIPESGQIIVGQQTNLEAFYNAKTSMHQLEPSTTGISRKDEFQNKAGLSNTAVNLNKINERESSVILDQYRKFSLRQDSPQSGWFKEPFIMRGIQRNRVKKPQAWGSFGIAPYAKRGGEIFSTPNNLVRGGISVIERSLVDALRIGKFMLGGPRGLLFIAQQIGLQLTAPKLESHPKIAPSSLIKRPTRVYNPATTLLQIAGNAAGLHLVRHGLIPTGENQDGMLAYQRYEAVAKRRNTMSAVFRDTVDPLLRTKKPSKDLRSYENSYNRLLNLASDAFYTGPLNIHSNPSIGGTWNYLCGSAGPNSVYGIGPTLHRRVENTVAPLEATPERTALGRGYIAMSNINRSIAIKDRELSKVIDFRAYKTGNERKLHPLLGGPIDTYRDGLGDADITLANKYGFEKYAIDIQPNPEDDGKTVIPESIYSDTIDEVGVVNSNRAGDPVDSYPQEMFEGMYDLIPLIFRDVDGTSNIMQFRCTLEAITDTFSPQWDSTTYMGRAEPVWHYKGAEARKIGTGFTAYATNRKSLKSMYQKLNRLAGYTMPRYEADNFNQMSAPLMQLTIGDYLRNQPGFLSSLSFNIENDVYWETTQVLDSKGEYATYRVPRAIKVDFEYTIIENDLVQMYKDNFGTLGWLDRV